MKRKRGFIWIFLENLDSPKSTVSVQCRKHCCIAKRSDLFVYAPYRVRVVDHHFVHFAVVDAKARCSVSLGTKSIGGANSVCAGRYHPWGAFHFSSAFEFFYLRPCLVWAWVNWLVIRRLELDSVLYRLNLTKMFVPQALRLFGHVFKFVMIGRQFLV